jgi:hypothetical protein
MESLKMNWRKSLYSGNGGNCTEVANTSNTVQVRDSKDVESPELTVSPASWRAFMRRLQRDS